MPRPERHIPFLDFDVWDRIRCAPDHYLLRADEQLWQSGVRAAQRGEFVSAYHQSVWVSVRDELTARGRIPYPPLPPGGRLIA